MAKFKFSKETYMQMLEEKLGGTTAYEEMKGKKKELSTIAQRLRQTVGRTLNLPTR